jgi:hypothetical protein
MYFVIRTGRRRNDDDAGQVGGRAGEKKAEKGGEKVTTSGKSRG